LGVGSTFIIYLPYIRDDGARVAPDSTAVTGGAETVLLVDGEASIRAVSRRFLESLGYLVLEAGHGAEALKISREYTGKIHLLLTDLVMPFMSGREIAFQLSPERPELRVLYMSGHPDDVIDQHGINKGVNFLPKPFSRSALANAVRQTIDSSQK